MVTHILYALIAMVIIAFFAGIEIAFLAASLVKIELKTRQNSTSARILSYFKKNMSKILITILIGNNLALMLYTQQLGEIFEPLFHNYLHLTKAENPFLLTFIEALLETAFLLVIAEYIPKSLFGRLADWIIYPAAYILQFFYWLLWIPVQFADLFSKLTLRLFNVSPEHEAAVLDRKDLDHYIMEAIESSEGTPLPQFVDTEILANAMTFNETKTREFQIPRTKIVALPIGASPSELHQKFSETQHSRIIIYGEDMDDIRGYVHILSMFKKPKSIEENIQPVLMVPETMSAQVLMKEFAEKRRSVAIVVDEFGGTSGLITMEDVMEEVFGEIDDEHDETTPDSEEDMTIKRLENGGLLIGARQEIYDLNEELYITRNELVSKIANLNVENNNQYHDPKSAVWDNNLRIPVNIYYKGANINDQLE
ncbi:MAG: hemolysin family protein [Bacteroidia bacterium]